MAQSPATEEEADRDTLRFCPLRLVPEGTDFESSFIGYRTSFFNPHPDGSTVGPGLNGAISSQK